VTTFEQALRYQSVTCQKAKQHEVLTVSLRQSRLDKEVKNVTQIYYCTSSISKKLDSLFGFVYAENYFKVFIFKLSHFPGNSKNMFGSIHDHF